MYREEDYAAGVRIVALKNDRKLDLQNGTLGTVREMTRGRALADLGGRKEEGLPGPVQMVEKKSSTLDHGRALTREVGHDIPGQGPNSQLSSGELAQKIRRLGRALQVRPPLQPAARTPELALTQKLRLELDRVK